MDKKDLVGLFLRYLILIIIAIPGLYVFYLIFTPLTIYPTYLILKLFYKDIVFQNSFFLINSINIQIIPACIAGSAYYLLLILNLATPMKLKTRIKSLIFLFTSFLLLNILRLSIFTILYLSNFAYFDITHRLVWYFGSTIFVVVLWFINVSIFKIKSIPAYTDLNSLYKKTKLKDGLIRENLVSIKRNRKRK